MKTLRQIMLALAMHFSAFEAFAQEQLKIFGTVTDEFDRPLVKIKISLKYIGSSESKARGPPSPANPTRSKSVGHSTAPNISSVKMKS